jgi:hypothetical protein
MRPFLLASLSSSVYRSGRNLKRGRRLVYFALTELFEQLKHFERFEVSYSAS